MIKFIAGFMLGIVTTFFWVYLVLSSFVESQRKNHPVLQQKQAPSNGTIEVKSVDTSDWRSTLKDI